VHEIDDHAAKHNLLNLPSDAWLAIRGTFPRSVVAGILTPKTMKGITTKRPLWSKKYWNPAKMKLPGVCMASVAMDSDPADLSRHVVTI
jgi:hypothetical protein